MRKLIIILLFTATASASIFINSFNSGQLSKDMKVRHDLDKTSMGSEELENILIRPQGMAYKRPGTEFIDYRIAEVNIVSSDLVTVGEYPTLQELTAEEIPNAPAKPEDTALVGASDVDEYAELQAMAGAGHYNITGDIDLNGETWTPIANFSGVIEGNNYTISNLTINAPTSDYQAFFANLSNGAEIRNLNFVDSSITADDAVAVLAGKIDNAAAVTLKNINITDSTIDGDYAVATFIGEMDRAVGSNFYDCNAVNSTITVTVSSPTFVAGFIGFLGTNSGAGYTNFVNCSVQGGTITTTATSNTFYVGGFGGYLGQYLSGSDAGGQFFNCYSTMSLSINGDADYAEYIGGFVGKSVFSDYTTCYSTGGIAFDEIYADLVGGFAGELRDFNDVVNCYATGDITFNYTGASTGQSGLVGGFIGLLENQISVYIPGGGHILRCYSTGDITYETGTYTFAEGTAGTGIGGFIGGKLQQNFSSTGNLIERCWAEGDISISAIGAVNTTYYIGIGGFIGSLKTTSTKDDYSLTMQNCYAWGSITLDDGNTDAAVGGFMGSYVTGDSYPTDLTMTNVYDAQTDTAAGSGYSNQLPVTDKVGGLIGYVDIGAGSTITVNKSYWDTDTSDILTDEYATAGHLTPWMQTRSSYENEGWDFDTIWILTETEEQEGPITITFSGSLANSPIRLIPFEYSTDDAYVLVFGHRYISFLRTTQ